MINMANTFNNEGTSPLFGLRVFTVCSTMVINWKPMNCIFYWGRPVQVAIMKINFSFSWRLYTLAFVLFSYAAESRLSFHYWMNSGWMISFHKDSTYVMKVSLWYPLYNYIWFEYKKNQQILNFVWCGENFFDTGHNIVWIICLFCMNYLFYFIRKFCQII